MSVKVRVLPFAKYEGAGNDFIIADGLRTPAWLALEPAQAAALCDRHYGIGADGVLLLQPDAGAEWRLRILNADGSEAQMCGNGVRCAALYLYDTHGLTGASVTFVTPAGRRTVRRVTELDVYSSGVSMPEGPFSKLSNIDNQYFAVSMGVPHWRAQEIPTTLCPPHAETLELPLDLDGEAWLVSCVSMGNPHAVVFVGDGPDAGHMRGEIREEVRRLGPLAEHHPAFPEGVNFHLAQGEERGQVRMATWERGAGPTLACGTGACAVMVAGVLTGRLGRQVTVAVPGGTLWVSWPDNHAEVLLSGPARRVFGGEVTVV